MSELEQALAAVEAGNSQQAFALLARLIKQEPNHVAAWYTLSTLVDDEKKEATFLKKVVALEPNHEAARQRLAVLSGDVPAEDSFPTPSPTPVPAADFDSQAAGDTIPDWLREGDDEQMAPAGDASDATPAEMDASGADASGADGSEVVVSEADASGADASGADASELPGWLQDESETEWGEEVVATTASDAMAAKLVDDSDTSAPAPVKTQHVWDYLLYGLIGVAVILALLLFLLMS